MFVNENERQDLCQKTRVRVSRTKIGDFKILRLCLFIFQKIRAHKYIWLETRNDALPNSLMDSIASPKVKTTEVEGVGACSLARNILGVEGRVGAPKWD